MLARVTDYSGGMDTDGVERRRESFPQPASQPLSEAIERAALEGLGLTDSVHGQVDPWLRFVVRHRIAQVRMTGRISEDDIVQTAWVLMLRRLRRGPLRPKAGRRSGALLAYITVIANRLVFAEAGRLWRLASLPSGSQWQASAPSPSSVVGRAERDQQLRVRLDEAMALLEPDDRQIVRLRGIEGTSARDIGTLLGLPVTTIEKRYSRARMTLEARLGRVDTALLTPG